MVGHNVGRLQRPRAWWPLIPTSSAWIIVLWPAMAIKDRQKIWTLTGATSLICHILLCELQQSAFALKSGSMLHPKSLPVFYPLNSGNSISLLVPLISLSLSWRPNFFYENCFYWAASQTNCRLDREQGTCHPRTHWFNLCCNGDI